jgi:hypothetical protein
MSVFDNESQEGHDGREIAHLNICHSWGQFKSKGFYLNKIGSDPLQMFHDKCLSSSSLEYLKEDFYYTHIGKNNDPLPPPSGTNFEPKAFI